MQNQWWVPGEGWETYLSCRDLDQLCVGKQKLAVANIDTDHLWRIAAHIATKTVDLYLDARSLLEWDQWPTHLPIPDTDMPPSQVGCWKWLLRMPLVETIHTKLANGPTPWDADWWNRYVDDSQTILDEWAKTATDNDTLFHANARLKFANDLNEIGAWGALVKLVPAIAADRQPAGANDLLTSLLAKGTHLPHDARLLADALLDAPAL